MAWAKVDDGWWCHPKVLGLSMGARGLWVSSLSWSCAQRRPVVPATFVAMMTSAEPTDLAAELVDAGLWRKLDGGFEIHDWAEYQEKTLSEHRAEAGRKGGLKSRPPAAKQQVTETGSDQQKHPSPRKQTEATPKQTAVASGSKKEARGEAGTRPVPSRPDQTPLAAAPRTATDATTTTRAPDLLFEALATACGIQIAELTDSARGGLNKALQQIKQAGADNPGEIHARARTYRRRMPGATLTPSALAKHWPTLGSKPAAVQTPRAARCEWDCGQTLDDHDDGLCRSLRPRSREAV